MRYSLVAENARRNAIVLQYVRSMLQGSGKLAWYDTLVVRTADKPYSEETYRLMDEAQQLFGIQADAEDGLADFYTECVYGSDTNVFAYESNGDEFFHESNKPFSDEAQRFTQVGMLMQASTLRSARSTLV